MNTKTKADRASLAAFYQLKKLLKPGDTIYTRLCHVSKSGMMRVIDVYVIKDNVPLRISWSTADATGFTYNRKHEGVQVDGCGMDMGFEIVYSLSSALFPDGFGCIGKGESWGESCPSNDHSNGDRDYTIDGFQRIDSEGNETVMHWHSSGGYALRHRWL